ncbi:hypothetical protein [Methylomonas sp. HYX-M1]|uniref:hypothetical protein n=1 Tax=Methylomonas sp. HYX-M1 TaxID=3139307 RepID=UPI00345B807B
MIDHADKQTIDLFASKRPVGRPSTGQAKSRAEIQRAYRQRKSLANSVDLAKPADDNKRNVTEIAVSSDDTYKAMANRIRRLQFEVQGLQSKLLSANAAHRKLSDVSDELIAERKKVSRLEAELRATEFLNNGNALRKSNGRFCAQGWRVHKRKLHFDVNTKRSYFVYGDRYYLPDELDCSAFNGVTVDVIQYGSPGDGYRLDKLYLYFTPDQSVSLDLAYGGSGRLVCCLPAG